LRDVEWLRRSFSEAAATADASLAVQALWWAGKGDWEKAHHCAQAQEGDEGCDWVHGYLHHLEGDTGIAHYWYRRAGRGLPEIGSQEEWEEIARICGVTGIDPFCRR
jgi:hypothetical protein